MSDDIFNQIKIYVEHMRPNLVSDTHQMLTKRLVWQLFYYFLLFFCIILQLQ